MNLEKSKEILRENKLNLVKAGLENLPMTFVEINRFIIAEKKSESYLYADLVGAARKLHDDDYTCMSFFVKVDLCYYYRDYYDDAMKVVEALRFMNGYKEDEEE